LGLIEAKATNLTAFASRKKYKKRRCLFFLNKYFKTRLGLYYS